jgi:hypothetical protein
MIEKSAIATGHRPTITILIEVASIKHVVVDQYGLCVVYMF